MAAIKTCPPKAVSLQSAPGALRAVKVGNSEFVIGRVFTQGGAAKLLNRQPQVVYRWQQRNIFPPPALVDGTGAKFFADDEVRAFIAILGRHQMATPHYRTDHLEVREQLFAVAFHDRPDAAASWISARSTRWPAGYSSNITQPPA